MRLLKMCVYYWFIIGGSPSEKNFSTWHHVWAFMLPNILCYKYSFQWLIIYYGSLILKIRCLVVSINTKLTRMQIDAIRHKQDWCFANVVIQMTRKFDFVYICIHSSHVNGLIFLNGKPEGFLFHHKKKCYF